MSNEFPYLPKGSFCYQLDIHERGQKYMVSPEVSYHYFTKVLLAVDKPQDRTL